MEDGWDGRSVARVTRRRQPCKQGQQAMKRPRLWAAASGITHTNCSFAECLSARAVSCQKMPTHTRTCTWTKTKGHQESGFIALAWVLCNTVLNNQCYKGSYQHYAPAAGGRRRYRAVGSPRYLVQFSAEEGGGVGVRWGTTPQARRITCMSPEGRAATESRTPVHRSSSPRRLIKAYMG